MCLSNFKSLFFDVCNAKASDIYMVGVSGGIDSVVLLNLLVHSGFNVIVGHFNHQLRVSANEDADFVAGLAKSFNLPFVLGTGDIKLLSRQSGTGIEEEARKHRYSFLFNEANNAACSGVVVAHHADDQVETVLMHLLRGTGSDGLSGMSYQKVNTMWDTTIPLLRPLLSVWRNEIEKYASEMRLNYITDETNTDTYYLRNRIRYEIIPFLETVNPKLKKSLWQTADIISGDSEILQETVSEDWLYCVSEKNMGVFEIEYRKILELSTNRQRNLVRSIFNKMISKQRDFGYELIAQFIGFLYEPFERKTFPLLDEYICQIHHQKIICGETRAVEAFFCCLYPQWSDEPIDFNITTDGQLNIDSGDTITWSIHSRGEFPEAWTFFLEAEKNEAWVDLEKIPSSLTIRHFEKGDVMTPLGLNGGSLKLSDLFVNEKIVRFARKNYLLLDSKNGICWVPGLRLADFCRITEATNRMVHIIWQSKEGI